MWYPPQNRHRYGSITSFRRAVATIALFFASCSVSYLTLLVQDLRLILRLLAIIEILPLALNLLAPQADELPESARPVLVRRHAAAL